MKPRHREALAKVASIVVASVISFFAVLILMLRILTSKGKP
jgi:hypothetical protein